MPTEQLINSVSPPPHAPCWNGTKYFDDHIYGNVNVVKNKNNIANFVMDITSVVIFVKKRCNGNAYHMLHLGRVKQTSVIC